MVLKLYENLFLRRTLNKLKGSVVLINDINKSFGESRILNNVSLEIKKGEFFSLLGPSGCGKTTLLRIIAGFETPDSGDIKLDSTSIINLQPNERHVNTIFQNYALFPHLSVYENVAFPLRLQKKSEKIINEEVRKYLSMVKLEDHIKKMPSQLSGGQKQRVSIARALVRQPNVLLLDEPLSALDAKLRQHMLIELDSIHDQVGITFIFVTHDQQEALSVSDRVAVMHQGVVLQVGTPSQIYESPGNSFVADFIGETNFIEGIVVSVDDKMGVMNVEGIGNVNFYLDKPVKPGDFIRVTVRPEKIRITKEYPKIDGHSHTIVLNGIVDELIYTGFQTKFFVHLDSKVLFKVFKQHVKYFMDETPINWKDPVYIWWNPADGYLVEVEPR